MRARIRTALAAAVIAYTAVTMILVGVLGAASLGFVVVDVALLLALLRGVTIAQRRS